MAQFFVCLKFIKYLPIFKILSLSESGAITITLSLKIPPYLKCVATLPCEMSDSKATIENKTTFVTTHFKKLTTGNNVFIVPVIV